MKELTKQLNKIQQELKAPKSNKNSFGNYNYRSCEDILEAVKPLLGDTVLLISDEMVNIGDRYYVKATATLADGENKIENTAYAREAEDKKGMDASQITGATSSYARKYALNGLFAIDDTKDADTMDNSKDTATPSSARAVFTPSKSDSKPHQTMNGYDAMEKQINLIKKLCREQEIGQKSFKERFGIDASMEGLKIEEAKEIFETLLGNEKDGSDEVIPF